MRLLLAILCCLGALASGLTYSGARSDFRFRGCPEMARDDWAATANCSDGYFAMVAFGCTAIVLAALAGLLVWRGYA